MYSISSDLNMVVVYIHTYTHNLIHTYTIHIGQYNKEMPVSDVSLVCSSATGGAYTRTVSIAVKYIPSMYLCTVHTTHH